jgi:hypothetical protein
VIPSRIFVYFLICSSNSTNSCASFKNADTSWSALDVRKSVYFLYVSKYLKKKTSYGKPRKQTTYFCGPILLA